MTINLQTGGYIPPQVSSGVRGADIQINQKKPEQGTVLPEPAAIPRDSDMVASAEAKRYEQTINAARSLFKDVYVVSDKSFSIFKDASGQYITRYTSLRDGRVTYIPEQRLLAAFESRQRQRSAVLEVRA